MWWKGSYCQGFYITSINKRALFETNYSSKYAGWKIRMGNMQKTLLKMAEQSEKRVIDYYCKGEWTEKKFTRASFKPDDRYNA